MRTVRGVMRNLRDLRVEEHVVVVDDSTLEDDDGAPRGVVDDRDDRTAGLKIMVVHSTSLTSTPLQRKVIGALAFAFITEPAFIIVFNERCDRTEFSVAAESSSPLPPPLWFSFSECRGVVMHDDIKVSSSSSSEDSTAPWLLATQRSDGTTATSSIVL
jgi:hypothetical protein